MKKLILGLIIFIVIVIASFLIRGTVNKLINHRLLAEKIEKLPAFFFSTLDKNSFSSTEIKEGPVLIVHFHPECEYCYNEISEVLKSKIIESGTKVVLITNANMLSVTQFINEFPICERQGLITLVDTAYIFKNVFGKAIIPSTYLYDKGLNLIDVLYGEYKIETILKLLKVNGQSK